MSSRYSLHMKPYYTQGMSPIDPSELSVPPTLCSVQAATSAVQTEQLQME